MSSSQDESFSSNLTSSHQHPQEIHSNLVSRHQHSQKRPLDHLYHNICYNHLHPKQWLKRAQTAHKLPLPHQKSVPVIPNLPNATTPNHRKSYQDQIVLSNYKQLLRNHFQSQQLKDQDLHQLHKKCHHQGIQIARMLEENRELKRQMGRVVKEKQEKEEKVRVLSSDLRKLNRRYDNLLKESAGKQASLKAQMRLLREEKGSYEGLVSALKDSIHILKGRRVKGLQQVWEEWKHIFELASLQQCKLSKKPNH